MVVVLPGIELLELSLEPLLPAAPPGGVVGLLLELPGVPPALLSVLPIVPVAPLVPPAAPGVGVVPPVLGVLGAALGGSLGVVLGLALGGGALGGAPAEPAVPPLAPEVVLPVPPSALPVSFFSHAPSVNVATSAASNTEYFILVPLRKYSCMSRLETCRSSIYEPGAPVFSQAIRTRLVGETAAALSACINFDKNQRRCDFFNKRTMSITHPGRRL